VKSTQNIKDLRDLRIEDIDFDNEELKKKTRDVFDKVANSTEIDRYESTDASKILHTILPDFFVMWDDEIKDRLVGGRRMGATYAFHFLPMSAIEFIRERCDGKTLAKLVDEYNYMKHTKKLPYLQ
jgi:hypothetical protein